ncbi:MAG: aminotransferase class IV [Verrucomicrobia bacterium]|nr:aminotransferase class IV [Verrucomicrobiota bacterium]MBS0646539.1 aminotransferase class IV [Verrucomicrobiota bacterium]
MFSDVLTTVVWKQYPQPFSHVIPEDSLLTTLRVEQGCPFYLQAHIQRLKQQAARRHLSMPSLDLAGLQTWLKAYQHVAVLRLRILLLAGQKNNHQIVTQLTHVTEKVSSLRLVQVQDPGLCCPQFKTYAMLQRLSMINEAHQKGFDDAFTCSDEGNILESTFGNLFWIENNKLYLPDPNLPYYLGVTLTQLLQQNIWEIEKIQCPPEAISQQASVFRTNALHGPFPIVCLGAHHFKVDPKLTLFLQQTWRSLAFEK